MINNILQTWAVFLRIWRKVQMQQQGKSTFLETCAKLHALLDDLMDYSSKEIA